MATPEKRKPASPFRIVGALGVGLAAFSAYVFAATPTPYPLDSAELASAAFGLGVAHPPGEETALLWAKLFTLLPLGSVAFKVALSQALAGALAAVLVYLLVLAAAERLSLVTSATREGSRVVVAAASALAFAFSPAAIIVGNRAEVYALGAALALLALWLALRAHERDDPRPAFLAALVIGLGVGNHSLVAGLVGLGAVAAALPVLVRSRKRTRMLVFSVAAFAVGMLVHLYLPLRAGALFSAVDRGVDNVMWGDARTWKGFWWIVSARTFAEKTAVVHGHATPWDLPFLPIEELGVVFALLAPAGLYFLVRRDESRLVGVAVFMGAAGSMVAALVGGLDPANPDIRGYLGPAIALLAVLSGSAVALGLAIVRWRQLRVPLLAVFLLGALSRFPAGPEYPNLRHAGACDDHVRGLLGELPARAALFTHHFETGFLVGYQRLVEGARPDARWSHLAFAGETSYAERVSSAEPELREVVQAFRDRTGLVDKLSLLDRAHPVRIEPDVATRPEARRALGPAGDLWAPAARTSPVPMQTLPGWAVAEARQDRQVRGYLAWRQYIDAMWSCELGFIERARERFVELEKLVPDDERFRALERSCK